MSTIPEDRGLQRDAHRRTEMKQLEERLLHTQKLEVLGRLAAGVAHDFNNLLTIINGYSKLLLKREERDWVRSGLSEILEAGKRGESLIQQLLAFSRRQVLQSKVFLLNDVVFNIDKMLRRLVGEGIDIVTVLEAHEGWVKADPNQIGQVLMNMAVNARDAMPQGGKLTIETSNVALSDEFVQQHIQAHEGAYVMIAVRDTGCGMDEEVLEHIFEPFFTTKERGTGLGLATVYGIITQSGGFIDVDSKMGQGTTFNIYLPRLEGENASVDETPESKARVCGIETVLLVEDDEALRNLMQQALSEYGYKILSAAYASEAFQVAEQHAEAIHLLLTDVVLPQMGGRELAEHMKSLHPEMKVIYISGYADEAISRGKTSREMADCHFLQKPFEFEHLARKVRDALDVGMVR